MQRCVYPSTCLDLAVLIVVVVIAAIAVVVVVVIVIVVVIVVVIDRWGGKRGEVGISSRNL